MALFMSMIPAFAGEEIWESQGPTNGNGLGFLYYSSNGWLYGGGQGIFSYSTDEGASWVQVSSESSTNIQMAMDVTEYGGKLYVACGSGIYSSTDGKSGWTSEFSQDQAYGIDFDSEGNAYALTPFYVLFRAANSSTWKDITPSDVEEHPIFGILLDGERAFLKTGSDSYISTDKGKHWSKLFNETQRYPFYTIEKAGNKYLGFIMFTSSNPGLYESEDGYNWRMISTDSNGEYLLRVSYDKYTNRLFGFFSSGKEGTIKTSTDLGRTWVEARDGLGEECQRIYCFAFNPNGIVYTLGYDGNLYKRQYTLNSVEIDPMGADDALKVSQESGKISVEPARTGIGLKGVQMFNSVGDKISDANRNHQGTEIFTIDTDGLPSGVYFLRSNTSQGTVTSKLCIYR